MKYFKTYEAYKLGVNGVGSLKNSLAALKRQNINGRYVDPEILAQGIRNEYEAITGEKYEDEVQMSMDNTIADIIGHFKLDGPDFMAAWDKVVKESVNESMIGITTDKSFKPADLQKALDKAKIKGYKMDRLSMTLTALKLDKKYFNDAKKLIDDLGLSVMMAKESVNEAFIGPFVFNDRMSDEELKAMYNGALDGYANYSKGFQHSKSDYKQAYQEIEKILKKRGVSVDESVTEAKGGQIMPGDYVKTQYGDIYLRVDGKVGRSDAYVRVSKGKAGKRKTGLHDSMKLTLVNKDGLEESSYKMEDIYDLIAHHRFDKDFKKLSSKDKEWIKNDAKERGFNESLLEPVVEYMYYSLKDELTESVMNESYKGNFTDFKYDLEMAIDNMDISPKAIKAVKKKGKGYEVRLSSYMSDKSTWEKIANAIGATLTSFKKGNINIGTFE